MKATTQILCAFFALSFSLITFTSCNDDIEDVNFLLGTWMHQDDDSREYYQFLTDGVGYEWDEPLANWTDFQPRKEEFRYELNGSKLTIYEADGDCDVETVKLINDNRIKIGGDTYNRQ